MCIPRAAPPIINVTAQDYDKKPVATAFRAELSRWNWQKRSGEVVSTSQGQTGADGKGQVQFTISGRWRISRSHHCASRPKIAKSKTPPTCGLPA